MAITILLDKPLLKVGHVGPLLISLYRKATSLEVLDELDRIESEHVKKYPRISTLSLLLTSEGMLKVDEALRERGAEMSRKYDPHMVGAAIVVLSKGLSAVMTRTFLSGYFLVTRPEAPTRTFSTAAEAIDWLRTLPGQDADVKASPSLRADVEHFIA